ncbi:M48 family metallopeptidase [Anaerovorax odorimutans]|uniref:M48 family metallopeptidase n=1 Tax=Anaerovorax odorimutans TaxID=109327 RepID=UPI0003FD187D|nr:SprT family zinc-dependent metalloprotease [Anaerovorax odorimutans]
MIEYQLIRSRRKTLSLYVKSNGNVEVRAPYSVSIDYINNFVNKKSAWIINSKKRLEIKRENRQIIKLSQEEVLQYKNKAESYLRTRCEYYSMRMGVNYNRIRVNKAKSRWGSCSEKGNINFTYRLIFAPKEVIDYIVVHELAHLKEMNHSKRFWHVVNEIMPDYKERCKVLKDFQMKVEIVEGK